jgi:hypothetical protein
MERFKAFEINVLEQENAIDEHIMFDIEESMVKFYSDFMFGPVEYTVLFYANQLYFDKISAFKNSSLIPHFFVLFDSKD